MECERYLDLKPVRVSSYPFLDYDMGIRGCACLIQQLFSFFYHLNGADQPPSGQGGILSGQ